METVRGSQVQGVAAKPTSDLLRAAFATIEYEHGTESTPKVHRRQYIPNNINADRSRTGTVALRDISFVLKTA